MVFAYDTECYDFSISLRKRIWNQIHLNIYLFINDVKMMDHTGFIKMSEWYVNISGRDNFDI